MTTESQRAGQRLRLRVLGRINEVAERTAATKGISFDEALCRTIAYFCERWPDLAAEVALSGSLNQQN